MPPVTFNGQCYQYHHWGHRRVECTQTPLAHHRRDPTIGAWNMERRYVKERMEEAFAAAAACREMAHYWQERYRALDQVDLNRPWFSWGDPPAGFVTRWDSFQQTPPDDLNRLSFLRGMGARW